MKSQNYILTLSSIFIVVFTAYLLYPLSSEEFDIDWDSEMTSRKQRYLENTLPFRNKSRNPNVLLIIVDDLGKTDITLYGEGKVHTPHINRIGEEGVTFTQAYVTSPVCSPSRASIMTGRYPQRFGFVYQMHEFYVANRLQYYGYKYLVDSYPWLPRELENVPDEEMARKQGLPPSEIVLPELLRNKGYKTALIGKWHLGVHPQNLPCNFGFDYQYGFFASHTLYANEKDPDIASYKIEDDFSDSFIWEGQRNGPHGIYRNCDLIEEGEYLTNAITRECKEFIKAHADTTFFLVASYNAPHTPLQAPNDYVAKFAHIDNPVKRIYYAMIANLDDAIGDLIGYLNQLGLENNTLIFFISDNGGATYTHTTDNAPLKGGKITDFEGGVNVPFIMKWGDTLPSGTCYEHPVSSMDIFGTITSVLDISLPADRVFDGVDLMPHILDSSMVGPPHKFLYWNRGSTRAIRSEKWKMVWNEEFRERSLFNMTLDNFEEVDVLGLNQEIANGLENEYENWAKGMMDPLWPPLVYFVFKDQNKTYHFDN
jgi:arylsulfatase A-like enzyme